MTVSIINPTQSLSGTANEPAIHLNRRRVAAGLAIIWSVSLCLYTCGGENAVVSFVKMACGTAMIGFVPGAIAVSFLLRHRTLSLLEYIGLSIFTGFSIVQLLTIVSIAGQIASVMFAIVIWVGSFMGIVLLGLHNASRVTLRFEFHETPVLLAMAVLSGLLYLQGSPVVLGEDQIHIGVVRRLSALANPRLSNIYITPDMIYTYPFPGVHYFIAMVSNLSGLDPLFVYHKLRFFWGPAALTGMYVAIRIVFSHNCRLATGSILAIIAFVFSGSFGIVPNFYWAQLVPYSHVSDLAMGVLLPGLLVLTFYFFDSRNRGELSYFYAATMLMVLMLTIVHIREIVQYLVYLGSFLIALVLFRRQSIPIKRVCALIASTLLLVYTYLYWHRMAVGHVDSLVGERRNLLVSWIGTLSLKDYLFIPFHYLDDKHFFSFSFETLYYGWNPVIILLSPLFLWIFRKNLLVFFIGAGFFAYLLIIRFAFFAVPYTYLTYFEILFTPVRNVIFFIHMFTGVGIYYIATQAARCRTNMRYLGSVAAAVAVLVGLLWGFERIYMSLTPEVTGVQMAVGSVFLLLPIIGYLAVMVGLRHRAENEQQNVGTTPMNLRSLAAFMLLILVLGGVTYHRESAPFHHPGFQAKLSTQALVDQLGCNEQFCFPDFAVSRWVTENIPREAVMAMNMNNNAMPTLTMPVQIGAWPGQFVGTEFHRHNFPLYNRIHDESMAKYKEQPFFNEHESLEEKLTIVERMHFSHVLVDPNLHAVMTRVLQRWPDVFLRLYDDGRWSVYRINASGASLLR